MIKTNFHTHTCYCDGKNTPREMVLEAIERGFTTLGFSMHSFLKKDLCVVPSPDRENLYIREVLALKEEFKDKIKIFLGLEQDLFSDAPKSDFEYLIGSVHYIKRGDTYYSIDGGKEKLRLVVDKCFGGDFDAFAEEYFSLVCEVAEKIKPDIIGHFDLIMKYCEQIELPESDRYLAAAKRAIERLIPLGIPFEINTGAMSRGLRTTPYPSKTLLKFMFDSGAKIVFSSDCHNKDFLEYGFDLAEKMALEAGFTEHGIITENGIIYVPIEK